MLYMLGTLAVDTRPFSVDDVSRSASADIASKPLIRSRPGHEFMGEGEEEMTLSGQLLPTKIGGLNELEIAYGMMRNGTRFPIMRGDGRALGWFAFTSIQETHRELLNDGVGFVVRHSMSMVKVEPDRGAGQQVVSGLLSLFGLSER